MSIFRKDCSLPIERAFLYIEKVLSKHIESTFLKIGLFNKF